MEQLLLVLVVYSIVDVRLMSCLFCFVMAFYLSGTIFSYWFQIQKIPGYLILYLNFYFPSHCKFILKLLHVTVVTQWCSLDKWGLEKCFLVINWRLVFCSCQAFSQSDSLGQQQWSCNSLNNAFWHSCFSEKKFFLRMFKGYMREPF